MAAVRITKSYALRLNRFCRLLEKEQREAALLKTQLDAIDVYVESGRKFDKVIIDDGVKPSVRYFVQKIDGSIFGAKSPQAPNLSWYFGTLDSAEKWAWGDYHGSPVNDTTVRLVKSYGPFKHFMRVEK